MWNISFFVLLFVINLLLYSQKNTVRRESVKREYNSFVSIFQLLNHRIVKHDVMKYYKIMFLMEKFSN